MGPQTTQLLALGAGAGRHPASSATCDPGGQGQQSYDGNSRQRAHLGEAWGPMSQQLPGLFGEVTIIFVGHVTWVLMYQPR